MDCCIPGRCYLHWNKEITIWHCAVHGPEPDTPIERVRWVLLHEEGTDWPDIDPEDIKVLLEAYDGSRVDNPPERASDEDRGRHNGVGPT